ncbi:MAG TPA: DnaJ domain-containing protein, partial [Sphingorhabdus sp.]|nr:DnaJ domain-containing protein [Sphingorhabdus sp.]
MNADQPFVDYYHILQVSPNCDPKNLETAYRRLAKAYHPDHEDTADLDKFNAVMEAYKILRHPDYRQEYDILYKLRTNTEHLESPVADNISVEENNAL